MAEFRFAPSADANGASLQGKITLAPRRLVEIFGAPPELDGYKSSGIYVFEDDAGRVYTVYDWKCTSLFVDALEEGEALPTPQDFWSIDQPVEFNIGGHDKSNLTLFKDWLLDQTHS